jgi:hypothetical protein
MERSANDTGQDWKITHREGMRVLPRHLPAALPKMDFSGYCGLVSRAPERRPPRPTAAK